MIGFVQTAQITPAHKKVIEQAFDRLGLLHWLSEDQLESLSAVAGSGPAFNFFVIQAMIDSAIMLGFSSDQAKEYVLKTIEGSVALLKATGKSPIDLINQVASPGGTTIAGLKVMEERGVRAGILSTLNACYEKALKITNSMECKNLREGT